MPILSRQTRLALSILVLALSAAALWGAMAHTAASKEPKVAGNAVVYWPRIGSEVRMVGGKFQGSRDGRRWTDIYTIIAPPHGRSIARLAADPATFKYLRYLAPTGAFGNIAEFYFVSRSHKVTGGTPFGSSGSWQNGGDTFDKALDGDPSTYFDAPVSDNQFVGIRFGPAPPPPPVNPVAMRLLATPTFASSNQWGHGLNVGGDTGETSWKSFHTPTPREPDWLAVDISRYHPRRVYLRWCASGNYFYNHNWYGGGPGYGLSRDYTIDGDAAPGGTSASPKSGWVTLANVTGNGFHSRAHLLETRGFNWLRIRVTVVDGTLYNYDTSFSNFGVWDADKGTADTWLMLGDSIIDNSMSPDGFAGSVNAEDPSRFPAQENGGIAGSHSWDWVGNPGWIDTVLALSPAHNIGISLGTNDYYGGVGNTTEQDYYNNMTSLVHKILAAGKVPYLSTMFGSHTAGIQSSLASARRVHDRILAENPGCKAGPDFDTYFNEHTELFDDPQSNVHPNGAGNAAIRRLWAQVALRAYPLPSGTGRNQ